MLRCLGPRCQLTIEYVWGVVFLDFTGCTIGEVRGVLGQGFTAGDTSGIWSTVACVLSVDSHASNSYH